MTDIKQLHYETVTPLLKKTLDMLMGEPLFEPFRLVGGTSLSLRYGHRRSDDIDLFTEAEYGSLDYRTFEAYLRSHFPYYHCTDTTSIVSFGRSYYVGQSAGEYVKVDLMYTDPFIERAEVIDGIRMAGTKDIAAMKMNVVAQGGRKKDFWDLHMLLGEYSLAEMFGFHARRYEWEHDEEGLLMNFTDFSKADPQSDPACLLGKRWKDIKVDLENEANNLRLVSRQDIATSVVVQQPRPRDIPDVAAKLAKLAQTPTKKGRGIR